VTDLALAYFHQTIITSEFAGYLYRLPADPPEFRIGVEILELDEGDQKLYSLDVLKTDSLDSGSRFQGARCNPQTGKVYEYGTALEALLKAFIKLELWARSGVATSGQGLHDSLTVRSQAFDRACLILVSIFPSLSERSLKHASITFFICNMPVAGRTR
jgi:hypothetical protein